jgi:NAD(P)H-nitrite reductase large subunit
MSALPNGCVKQRDNETYAIRVTPLSGVVTPEELETVASVARKHNVPMLKITSGQRIALIGLGEEQVHSACGELPFPVGGHYIQACPGNQWCKLGVQNALNLAAKIEERFASAPVPAKIKIGVSGCPTCCAESYVRDIGLVGTRKGWTMVIGGNSGGRARIAEVLAEDLTADQALETVATFLAHYNEHGKKKQRVARFVEQHGIEAIREAVLQA